MQDTVKVGSVLIDVETGGGSAPATPAAPAAPAAAPAAAAPASAPAAGGAQAGSGAAAGAFFAASHGGAAHKVQAFKLADIGEGIAEVQLTEWFVKEGAGLKEERLIPSAADSYNISSSLLGEVTWSRRERGPA